jgi:threonine aldolase
MTLSRRLDDAFSTLFGRPVTALWVASGTAAIAWRWPRWCPHGGVICHEAAHIESDECGAPGFFTHGAKLMLAKGADGKIMPETILAVTQGIRRDVHRVWPHAISITQATEAGCVYRLRTWPRSARWRVIRGWRCIWMARFANAVAHLGCSPAAITCDVGVDALSFGFVKNGGMSAEALVYFNPIWRAMCISAASARAICKGGGSWRQIWPCWRGLVAGQCAQPMRRRASWRRRPGTAAPPGGGQRGVPAPERART